MATDVTTQASKPLSTANDASVAVVNNDEEDQGDEGEDDEDEVLEAHGRWQKIAEQVSQRDVPGIDAAYLAVDIEEGTEVVWNEVSFSKSKAKRDKEKVIETLKQLTRLKHPNIIKFYEFWCDIESATCTTHDRLVFITEYMTSGTLLQFLKKSKKNHKPVSEKTWKRWCQQILSALCYLHKLGVIHGNLTLDTIFIQHNGLVKIGSISPQDINKHVKTSVKNLSGAVHYMAPESGEEKLSQAADVYAFGICALEMLALELLGNGETRPKVHADEIMRAVDALQNESLKEFINKCLTSEPSGRPTARQLLLSPILQEVYTLLLYATRVWTHHINKTLESLPGSSDDTVSHHSYPSFNESDPDKILADAFNGKVIRGREIRQLDLEKYIEEHLVDMLYQKAISEERQQHDWFHSDQQPVQQSVETQRPKYDPETRRVKDGSCEINELNKKQIMIKLLFDDKLQRNITSDLNPGDTPTGLTTSLVNCGLINEADQHIVEGWIPQLVNTA